MRYIWSHIQAIIEQYNGAIPLTHFLKNYFRLNPKLGSRDRKIISEMAYCWYRVSKALPRDLSFGHKIGAALFLCETATKQTEQFIPDHLKESKSLPLHSRIAILGDSGLNLYAILPFHPDLSGSLNENNWIRSLLSQPRLFLRVRKNKVLKILSENGINYEIEGDSCLSLPNGSPVDRLLPASDYVVQDASSQRTGNYFHPLPGSAWWDCCSGAGGKSLLLKDLEPSVRLTVSDKRSSILHNLADRFRSYKLPLPETIVADATDGDELETKMKGHAFDNIICDVPCTGSGTWARTPEQLYFFKKEYLAPFAERQKSIATNVSRYLKPGGRLIYITCSIFREENEEVIEYLQKEAALSLEEVVVINGMETKADSMFVAVLRK